MKKHWAMVCGLGLASAGLLYAQADKPAAPGAAKAPAAAPGATAGAGEFKTNREKVSYGIGLNIGRSIKRDGLDVDTDLIVRGLRDAVAGAQQAVSEEDLRAAMQAFQTEMEAKEAGRMETAGKENKAKGDAFLAENKKKEGVKTTASGLQYQVLTEGTGKSPAASDKVKVHYKGTLLDGTEFDSSYKRGEPAVFPVGGVIKGWTEALQLMKVGGKYKLFIPSDLAYGPTGAGGVIAPNSVLIFEVELLGIEQ